MGIATQSNTAPAALATSGVFRCSRNPFHVGMLLIVGGVFVLFSLDWVVLILLLFWLALDRLAVPNEGKRLEAASGRSWHTYAGSTRHRL